MYLRHSVEIKAPLIIELIAQKEHERNLHPYENIRQSATNIIFDRQCSIDTIKTAVEALYSQNDCDDLLYRYFQYGKQLDINIVKYLFATLSSWNVKLQYANSLVKLAQLDD